ncbi:two component, sigma54 specific, transcriptional regulator, Fis family [Candidatus Koribacter versatilis Ellin345]|uniref:Two component, sigma54 specific, transcriptional regulator, Fis family n=1 Tax=Koribacter versatilis (strain Ellin345) TaxID=204669 RepID=Q1ILI0_KORVE|nr:sigma-54 dependent transcriptional regulator [Candidatus Koribacter versatilis]ABF42270.1 two component, sigma54 specific, transcriptional regulator, Fis family [Candidatus Koribacter versatilis Ellin345]
MTVQQASTEANLLNLLIVDDERVVREGCRDVAQTLGFSTFTAENAEQAYKILDSTSVDVILLDLRLPGIGGLEALRQIKQRRPETIVIVVTGYATVQSAVQAMKHGAFDYVTKPFNMDELRILLDRVTGHLKLTTENRMLREQVKARHGFGGMVGRAPEMERLYRIITKAANSTHPVLIMGESGTGKEVVARAVHYTGCYKDKPFIPVDCGSLVPTLIESELFGYVKGAFTGAQHSKQGLLAMADGGTVFLDEIGELPIDLQSKLLRALQEKEIRPVGGTRAVPINVRILAATNRDLEQAVQQGTFRRDLYFRLNVLTLRIPPLRDRKQDIPLLVGHFLERTERATGFQRNISDEALKLMLTYDWPGNVRELEHCLDRACALTSGPTINTLDLPTTIQNWHVQTQTVLAPQAPAAPTNGIVPIAEMEKQAILEAIERLHGDKLEAARLLGIGKTTLYRKLKEYGAAI